jgi:hypothetical protein
VSEDGICCARGESFKAFWALSAKEDKKPGTGIFIEAEMRRWERRKGKGYDR